MIFAIFVIAHSARPIDPFHRFSAKLPSLKFRLVTIATGRVVPWASPSLCAVSRQRVAHLNG